MRWAARTVHALRGVDLTIHRGEYVAIMGPHSGSGKIYALMNLIGCLDTPTMGRYWLAGRLVSELDDDDLAAIRNKEIGFVFQNIQPIAARHGIAYNVELPMIYNGTPSEERLGSKAKHALESVDLGTRIVSITSPASFPAASASAWRWLAPWSNSPSIVLAGASRPEIWTLKAPAMRSWPCSRGSTATAIPSSSSHTRTMWPGAPTASSTFVTAKWKRIERLLHK